MIFAGEISGDTQGAKLAEEILKLKPAVVLFGLGGSQMARAGVKILKDSTTHGVFGLFEVLRHLPAYIFLYFKTKKKLTQEKPDLLILIDNQGFNLLLAKHAKTLDIPTVYYIAPQDWRWGVEYNMKTAAALITKILAIFPEEAEIYRKMGRAVSYIGNPVVDLIDPEVEKAPAEEVKKILGLNPQKKYIGLLPGSRWQEIEKLGPVLIGAAEIMLQKIPELEFLVPVADQRFLPVLEKTRKKSGAPVHFFPAESQKVIKASEIVLVASGTVSLEAALLEVPMVIVYKLSGLTEWVGRKILKINPKMIGLPNFIYGEMFIPELTQKEANSLKIAQTALEILADPAKYQEIKKKLAVVKEKCGPRGAVKRAAQEILEILPKRG